MNSTLSLAHPPAEELADFSRRVDWLEQQAKHLSQAQDGMTLCVFSGELDRLLAAFTIANGAAACGMRVTMFFTFWATNLLRRSDSPAGAKRLVERMFRWMLPAGPDRPALSRLHMGGVGRWLIGREMRRKGIPGLPELLRMAEAGGVEVLVCGMSMDLMGIREDELIAYPNLRVCGAVQFADVAASSKTCLFI